MISSNFSWDTPEILASNSQGVLEVDYLDIIQGLLQEIFLNFFTELF